jgi:diphthamide synthase (EF-2-diphthine--ammonia ligase)
MSDLCSPVCPQGDCANCMGLNLLQARRVLDSAKAGASISHEQITRALVVCGDIGQHVFAPLDRPARANGDEA